jgi:hypothetical protein
LHYDPLLADLLFRRVRGERGTQTGGWLLELLAGYLFWTSGEYDVWGSTRGLDAETDLRVRSTVPAKPPHLDLGAYLLVECKNRGTRTGAAAIKKFATDVRLAGCRCGVLVSLRGVTGSPKTRDAAYTIRKLYHADGTVIIALDESALDDIVHTRISLVDALRQGYEAIRFDF